MWCGGAGGEKEEVRGVVWWGRGEEYEVMSVMWWGRGRGVRGEESGLVGLELGSRRCGVG